MSPSAKKSASCRRPRRLRLQALETRRLLAADAIESHNIDLPEDVNADGAVTSIDALMVLNRLRRAPRENRDADATVTFDDVNRDGNVTGMDALRVIHRLGRSRGDSPGRGGDSGRDDDSPPGESPEIEVRSLDGSGNNLNDPSLGSTDTVLRRIVDSDYADGVNDPSGANRPSAREVSNVVSAQEGSIPNARGLSDLVWQWGQFVDHDVDLTAGGGVAFDIEVPTGDPFFDPLSTGEQTIGLKRSGVADGTGTDADHPAEQVNQISSFIDGSMVYGSDAERASALRSFEGGRLLTSEGDLLPFNTGGFDNAGGPGDSLFLAGDVRANEQAGLTAMHTLWVREHNRVADEIAADDSRLSDEQVYQMARSIVIGEIQAITFNEYLPALLGRDAIPRYKGYHESVDPSISNLFATAVFRYGHTALPSELPRVDREGKEIEAGNLPLRDAFFNPSAIIDEGIDSLLMGMASHVSQEIDTKLVDDVRNFLFGPPGSGGFDLASLNIQRGRDHGLPDYNSVREQLGLQPAESFSDITSDRDLQAELEQIYGDVDDIDVWVGALAEDHVRGGSVGELTRSVLVEQFTALRDGDRFWYQNTFRGQLLREIDSTRLSDVIERNTEATSLRDNVFFVPAGGKDRPPRPPGPDGPPRDDVRADPPPRDRRPPLPGPPTGNQPAGHDAASHEDTPPPPALPPVAPRPAAARGDVDKHAGGPPRREVEDSGVMPGREADTESSRPLGGSAVDQVFSNLR